MIKNKNNSNILWCKFFITPFLISLISVGIPSCSKKITASCPVPITIYSQDEKDIARKNLDKKGIPFSSQSLTDAIESNDAATVLDMIKLGINLEKNDEGSSHTPLTASILGNKSEIIDLLVKNGASVNTKDGNGHIPFILGISSVDSKVAKELINNCANVNIYDGSNNEYRNALLIAIDEQKIELVQLLIQKGANVNKAGGFGLMPLNRASTFNSLGIVKVLVENGANIKYVSKNGWTPLMNAIDDKQYEIAKYLIEHGVMLNTRDKKGNSAVSLAKVQGRQDILDLLASKGVSN